MSGAACTPQGPELEIEAEHISFDTDCLAAPADTSFTITFKNDDASIPHNLAIFAEDPLENPDAEVLFRGDTVTGPDTATYEVGTLPAGQYHFHCDFHPKQMFGVFVVQ
jgi:plastocyanin